MTVNKKISFGTAILVNEVPVFPSKSRDARGIFPGRFGSQYPRLLRLKSGQWLSVYTVYRNQGYSSNPLGGNELEIAISRDCCLHWTAISVISDPGHDMDNGQMIETENGDILLACRSVIWGQSYRLPVYISHNRGKSWGKIGLIDENSGKPDELSNPDLGVYEPHFCYISPGTLGVMYASEKYATADPAFSQIIVEKISTDGGSTWGEEIVVVCDELNIDARPGMPVWQRLKDGSFIVVYEIMKTQSGKVFYKKSLNGVAWESGIGRCVPEQRGGAYVLQLPNEEILVTSNTHHITISDDGGETWYRNAEDPWETLWKEPKEHGAVCVSENGNVWPSMYLLDSKTIIYITSVGRSSGGSRIELKFGILN